MQRISLRKKQFDAEKTICYCIIVVVSALLFLRDVRGYAVNKYFFLVLLAPALIFFHEKNMYKVWAFCMPLYVGLPGNFLTIILLVRFFLLWLNNNTIKLNVSQFILTLILCMFVFTQNIIMNYTSVYYMIYIIEYIVIYFIFSTERKEPFSETFLFYSCGIALVGIVMLLYTLRFVSFAELTSVASRLGDFGQTSNMTIIIDPNYYGLFAIISIAGNWCMISKRKYTLFQSILAIMMVAISLFIALIGLSRAFVLCLGIWFVLTFITEQSMKIKVGLLIVVGVAILLALTLVPDFIDSIVDRFQDDSMETGGGRTSLIEKWIGEWSSSLSTILFGVGIFMCNAHCMQVQFLAGLGIIGFGIILALMISYIRMQNVANRRIINWSAWVPIVVVQVAAATIPVAHSMTFMMPVIMSILVYGVVNKK